jgi:hypothetical protein
MALLACGGRVIVDDASGGTGGRAPASSTVGTSSSSASSSSVNASSSNASSATSSSAMSSSSTGTGPCAPPGTPLDCVNPLSKDTRCCDCCEGCNSDSRVCVKAGCVIDGACSGAGDCCSGICDSGSGMCVEATCRVAGGHCTDDIACCSHVCALHVCK